FRRGLELDPNDATLREHLRVARAQVVYSTPAELGRPADDAWPGGLPRPLPWMPAAMALIADGCGGAALARRRRPRPGRPAGPAAVGWAVGVRLGRVGGVGGGQGERGGPRVGGVAEDGVLLRKGNGLSSPPAHDAPVNRGVEAQLLAERGGWLQVGLAGGETG